MYSKACCYNNNNDLLSEYPLKKALHLIKLHSEKFTLTILMTILKLLYANPNVQKYLQWFMIKIFTMKRQHALEGSFYREHNIVCSPNSSVTEGHGALRHILCRGALFGHFWPPT
jgi:hypothetical protein